MQAWAGKLMFFQDNKAPPQALSHAKKCVKYSPYSEILTQIILSLLSVLCGCCTTGHLPSGSSSSITVLLTTISSSPTTLSMQHPYRFHENCHSRTSNSTHIQIGRSNLLTQANASSPNSSACCVYQPQ